MNDFTFEYCLLKNIIQITPKIIIGDKDVFVKNYEKEVYVINGIDFIPTEEYRIKENEAIFRGIHFQSHIPQKRLITVISGGAYITVVDLDRTSHQLGKYETFRVEGVNPKLIYVPEWYGVATISLENNTVISVMSEGRYCGQYSSGIRYDDETLNIQWPIHQFEVSKKDMELMSFKDYLCL